MRLALASDLDGTLLVNNSVPHYNRISINNLTSNQDLFIIATGRPYNSVNNLVRESNIHVDYKVLLNGSLILDKNEDVLLHKSISFNIVENIIDYVIEYKPNIVLETGYKTYALGNVQEDLPYHCHIIDSVKDISDEKISLISLCFKGMKVHDIDKICNLLNILFNGKCSAYRNLHYIDVVPTGCSKGGAVLAICEKENIPLHSLYTIGDSFNDVSMFDITKNSFTFHNCENSLKDHANNIVDSVSECIENYMLNKAIAD